MVIFVILQNDPYHYQSCFYGINLQESGNNMVLGGLRVGRIRLDTCTRILTECFMLRLSIICHRTSFFFFMRGNNPSVSYNQGSSPIGSMKI